MLGNLLRPSRALRARPLVTLAKFFHAAEGGRRQPTARKRLQPGVECLEDRSLLSVTGPSVLVFHPGAFLPASSSSLPAGLSPAQVRHAYGFDQISFGSVAGNGNGQTIAIVDAYNQPNIASNLATFDATYGIAAPPSFTEVNETGGTALPAASASWGLEISLDVEWAHAIAPGAKILLVEASSASLTDLLAGVNYARSAPGVSVVSMSWGSSEWSGESAYDSYFTTPAGHTGVTFVASSGDSGSAGAPEWPSVSPNVLAVGGTQLSVDASGDYEGEIGWSGSGGGISAYESQPAFQRGVVTQSTTKRTVPDVSYDGSGSSPFAVYDTDSYSGWVEVYGTSAGAPQWSALVAIADQGRALAGKAALDGATQALPAIYSLPSADFHDVTSGSNGGYSAGPGYDLVTGRGSPLANLVVAGLVGGASTPPPASQPPVIVTAAHANANPVTGTMVDLSVLGNDAAGAATLTYTWSVLSSPGGVVAPSFGLNGTNAAQNTDVTFHGAGTYSFLVTVKDAAGLSVTSSVSVTVDQTASSISVTPGTVTLVDGQQQQFAATVRDQFGNVMSQSPSFTWGLYSGAGQVASTGLFTAPSTGNGSTTLRVSGDGLTAYATVSYHAALPPAPTNLTATPVGMGWILLQWTNNGGGATGFVIERSTNGANWNIVGAVGGNVNFFDDMYAPGGGSYSYRIYAYNNTGDSAYSNATGRVTPAAVASEAFWQLFASEAGKPGSLWYL